MTLHVIGEGQRDGVGAVLGRAVVLATGGLGQVFTPTTNPAGRPPATAWRSRCGPARVVADLEFVQFHPTVLWLGPDSPRPAAADLRGGARRGRLPRRRRRATRFMQGQHELADLAPRDVVAKAIIAPDARDRQPTTCGSTRGTSAPSSWEQRFPTILAPLPRARRRPGDRADPGGPGPALRLAAASTPTCAAAPSCPACTPAARCACTGVHGANRLASNSLLEGLVFARRIADDVTTRFAAGELPLRDAGRRDAGDAAVLDASHRLDVQRGDDPRVGAGALRRVDRGSRSRRSPALAALPPSAGRAGPADVGDHQPAHLGQALSPWRTAREETRGWHWRADFPERDDARWLAPPHDDPAGRRGRSCVTERPVRGPAHDRPTGVPAPPTRLLARRAAPSTRTSATGSRRHDDGDDPGMPSASVVAPRGPRPTVSSPGCRSSRSCSMPSPPAGRRRGGASTLRVADGDPGRARRRPRDAARARPATCSSPSAPRSTSLSPPPGVATAHPALGRRARGHRARWCSTPARRRPGCARWRSTPCAAAAAPTTGWACTTSRWSRTTTSSRPGGLDGGVRRGARHASPTSPVQVEVTTTAEALEAVAAGARFLLCDNMSPDLLRETVDAVRATGESVELEATGGLTLEVAAEYAATGRRLPLGRGADPLLADPRHRPRPRPRRRLTLARPGPAHPPTGSRRSPSRG